jgi:hypothetical protein
LVEEHAGPPALQQTLRFDAWLWQRIDRGARPTLDSAYQEIRDPEDPEQLTVLTVLADEAPLTVLHRHANRPSWVVGDASAGAMLVEIPDDAPFVISSWTTERPGVYVLAATVPVTDKRWRRVERWIHRSAPSLVPVYLDRRHFEGFVSSFGEFGDVDVSRLTGRYRMDQSSYSRGWPQPKSAREALEEVHESVQLRTMTLSLLSDPKMEVQLRVHVRRLAGATFYAGDFQLFQELVLDRLIEAVAARGQLLSGRARVVGEPTPPPVEVRIGAQLFDLPDASAEFLKQLSSYANADTAVLHRNPYWHAVVTDYLDGSNFDVVVTENDVVTIHPGFAASMGAMVRLTTFLSEEFEADAVGVRSDREPARLEDLFSTQ